MLLSVVIPTYERTELLIKRSLPSVLSQRTPMTLEVIVVGDGEGPATGYALSALGDPRVYYVNLERPDYPEEPTEHWSQIGLAARNWGYDNAEGQYIMGLDDDDALVGGAIEKLHGAIERAGADLAYGRSVAFNEHDQPIAYYGFYPPKHFAYCEGAWLARHDLGYRFELDPVKRGSLPGDGDKIDRMVGGGVKFTFVDEVVHHYWPNRHPMVKVGH